MTVRIPEGQKQFSHQCSGLRQEEFTVTKTDDVVQHIYLDDLISEGFVTLFLFCVGGGKV